MQTASASTWNRITMFIYYNNNHHTTSGWSRWTLKGQNVLNTDIIIFYENQQKWANLNACNQCIRNWYRFRIHKTPELNKISTIAVDTNCFHMDRKTIKKTPENSKHTDSNINQFYHEF